MTMVSGLTQKTAGLHRNENNTPSTAMDSAGSPTCSSVECEKHVKSNLPIDFVACEMCVALRTECSPSCGSKRWEQKKQLKKASMCTHAHDGGKAEEALMTPEKIPRPLQQGGNDTELLQQKWSAHLNDCAKGESVVVTSEASAQYRDRSNADEPVELTEAGLDLAAPSKPRLYEDAPQKPPGPHWTEYEHGDVIWYYYEGPLGTWWYDKDMTEPELFCDSSEAAEPVQDSGKEQHLCKEPQGDGERAKSTTMKSGLVSSTAKHPEEHSRSSEQKLVVQSAVKKNAPAPYAFTPPGAVQPGQLASPYAFTPAPTLTKKEKKELREKEAAEQALAQAAEQRLAEAEGKLEDCVLVFYDFETTGLDWRIEGITEIAAQRIHYKNGSWVRDGEKLEFFVNPGKPVPRFITELTGITTDMVRDAVSLEDGLAKLQAYIAESAPRPTIPMAHNGKAYDRQFPRYRWPKSIRGDFDPPNVKYWGDSISLFKLLDPGRFQKYKLGMLYESLNGPPSDAHRALADVRMMEFCINALWSSRVQTFDSRLATLHRLASTKKGAPPEAKLQNSTLFELDET